jgi:hypothetical protein
MHFSMKNTLKTTTTTLKQALALSLKTDSRHYGDLGSKSLIFG